LLQSILVAPLGSRENPIVIEEDGVQEMDDERDQSLSSDRESSTVPETALDEDFDGGLFTFVGFNQ
jgi:hypothetical protein